MIQLLSGWTKNGEIWHRYSLHGELNITPTENSLLVGSKLNDFLTIFLVNGWPVRVQLSHICVQYD